MNSQKSKADSIIFRRPELKDASGIHNLIKRSPPLDVNSLYCYLLLCDHFRNTCIVAEKDRKIIGFIAAYLPPTKLDTLFVWQVVVAKPLRNRSLATKMLNKLLQSTLVLYIETTVTPSNDASMRFFRAFAHAREATLLSAAGYARDLFGNNSHEEELLLRLGPFDGGNQTIKGDIL